MTPTPTAEQIAGRLTKTERKAICLLNSRWQAGPDLPDVVIENLAAFREAGLVDHIFADQFDLQVSQGQGKIHFNFGACWYFRLNDTGLAVRDHLRAQGEGHD